MDVLKPHDSFAVPISTVPFEIDESPIPALFGPQVFMLLMPDRRLELTGTSAQLGIPFWRFRRKRRYD
jgi:hypothetical protein